MKDEQDSEESVDVVIHAPLASVTESFAEQVRRMVDQKKQEVDDV